MGLRLPAAGPAAVRRPWRIAGGVAALAIGAYFAWEAIPVLPRAAAEIPDGPAVWIATGIAAAAYATIIPVTAVAWKGLLQPHVGRFEWHRLARIMARTQAAKYVPGNVAQHALRATLAARAGIPVAAFAGTVTQETILAILASLFVGVVAAALSTGLAGGAAQVDLGTASALVVGGALLAAAVGYAAHLLGGRTSGWLRHAFDWAARYLRVRDPRPLAMAFVAYCANFVLIGAGLAVLAASLGLSQQIGPAEATAVFALSWILGFLAPGAPAGLGVREGIMLALLSGPAPQEGVVIFVLLARLATMVGDAACFAIGWLSPATGLDR
jgi:uncharacterized membrane protein YbhN (UPF0104 family)